MHTFKAYSKEAKRLLLWCVYKKGLALAELKVQDVEQYFHFLEQPPNYWSHRNSTKKKNGDGIGAPRKKGLNGVGCRMAI